MLPETLKLKLEEEAKKNRISFGELIRQVLEKYSLSRKNIFDNDPFLLSQTVFVDSGPTNVAEKHDDYLIEKGPH